MTPRERVNIYRPNTTKNNSGGRSVTDAHGALLVSALAEVRELKPTREQIAEGAKLGKTIEVKMWARKDVVLAANDVLRWNGNDYSLLGPATNTKAIRTEWLLYAKTMSA